MGNKDWTIKAKGWNKGENKGNAELKIVEAYRTDHLSDQKESPLNRTSESSFQKERGRLEGKRRERRAWVKSAGLFDA